MKNVMKRVGIGAGAFVLFVLAAAGGIFGFSSNRINKTYSFKPDPVTVPTDAASIEHGRHLAIAVGKCVDCHAPDLGGKIFIDDPKLGRLTASNLTRGKGGVGAKYDNEKFIRVLRHGVKQDGHPALFMPSDEFANFNSKDLGDLAAYLNSLPPVDRELPPSNPKLLARVLYVAGQFPLLPVELIKHDLAMPSIVAPGATVEYGAYLASVGCKGCHGQKLNGGHVPGTPPEFPNAQNITPAGIGDWTEADFTRALRVGVRKDGTKIDPFMPWILAGQMTDEEIHALWLYVKTLPSVPTPKS
jgi:mono/diheme cytochrome c family protein